MPCLSILKIDCSWLRDYIHFSRFIATIVVGKLSKLSLEAIANARVEGFFNSLCNLQDFLDSINVIIKNTFINYTI